MGVGPTPLGLGLKVGAVLLVVGRAEFRRCYGCDQGWEGRVPTACGATKMGLEHGRC